MSLEAELKKLVEGLRPDLRPYMRFTVTGRVAAVYEEEYTVDVEIDGDVSLPRVPVGALWAKSEPNANNAWGLWALPELGSEVSIGFREGDVTRPYVENALWPAGGAPTGYRVGMFVIRDRSGQSMSFKPDDGTVDLQVQNLRVVTAGNQGEVTLRDRLTDVGGKWTIRVHSLDETVLEGAKRSIEGDLEEIVAGIARREVARFVHTVTGAVEESIGGALQRRIGAHARTTVLGPRLDAIAKHWQTLVGGNLEFTITNADAAAAAFAVKALAGNVSLETAAGLIQLGGATAVAPAVLGTQLVQVLTDLANLFSNAIAIVQSPTPAGPVPTPLDPALNVQLQAWVASLATASFLSTKVSVA